MRSSHGGIRTAGSNRRVRDRRRGVVRRSALARC